MGKCLETDDCMKVGGKIERLWRDVEASLGKNQRKEFGKSKGDNKKEKGRKKNTGEEDRRSMRYQSEVVY